MSCWDMSWQGTKPSSWKRWASRSRSWLCHTLPMIWSMPSSPRRCCWDQLGKSAGKCWVDLLICWTSLALICCTHGEDELLHYTQIVPELKQTGTSDCNFEKFATLDSDSMVQQIPNLDLTTESCFHTVSISQSISTLKSSDSSDSSDSSHIMRSTRSSLSPSAPQPSLSPSPEVFQHVTSEGWASRPRSWKSSRHWNWSVQAMAGHGTGDHRALGKLR